MKKDLNLLEQAIISEIVNFNKKKYPFIKNHVPFLKVKSRESTGVGVYINFNYVHKKGELLIDKNQNDIVLSSDKDLKINILKFGLNYELVIINGKFNFLELVTNGESWDGNYDFFKFDAPRPA